MYRKPKKKKDESFPLLENAGVSVPKKVNYKDRADCWFSKYIRMRDAMANGYVKCISCGKIVPVKESDNGHYLNRQHMSTRFSEMNCNAQCRSCNRFDEGNMSGYRRGLVAKYGEEKVQWLESQKNVSTRYGNFEYEAIINDCKKKVKELEKKKGFKI